MYVDVYVLQVVLYFQVCFYGIIIVVGGRKSPFHLHQHQWYLSSGKRKCTAIPFNFWFKFLVCQLIKVDLYRVEQLLRERMYSNTVSKRFERLSLKHLHTLPQHVLGRRMTQDYAE